MIISFVVARSVATKQSLTNLYEIASLPSVARNDIPVLIIYLGFVRQLANWICNLLLMIYFFLNLSQF